MKAISEREDVSLEYEERKAQMSADRELRELDDDEDEETEKKKKRRRKRNEQRKDDVVLDEGFKVLMDLIRLTGGEEVPEQKGWWF